MDIFVGGKSGPNARAGTKILEDVPCSELPDVLERLIPYIGKRPATVARPKESAVPSPVVFRPSSARCASCASLQRKLELGPQAAASAAAIHPNKSAARCSRSARDAM